jgi:phosphatidate cytidylyltransferase
MGPPVRLGRTASISLRRSRSGSLLAIGPLPAAIFGPTWVWIAVTAVWVVGGASPCARAGRLAHLNGIARFAIGWLLIGAAWRCDRRAKLRGLHSLPRSAARVGGRHRGLFRRPRFGRRKLAPTISPGKSWEGAWSGLGACSCWRSAVVAVFADRPISSRCCTRHGGWAGLVVACAALVALAIVGDLCESLAKRAAGARIPVACFPARRRARSHRRAAARVSRRARARVIL